MYCFCFLADQPDSTQDNPAFLCCSRCSERNALFLRSAIRAQETGSGNQEQKFLHPGRRERERKPSNDRLCLSMVAECLSLDVWAVKLDRLA